MSNRHNNHVTNPRAVREARNRQARLERAERVERLGKPRQHPEVVGYCATCSVELRDGDEFERLEAAGPEPALRCAPCQAAE